MMIPSNGFARLISALRARKESTLGRVARRRFHCSISLINDLLLPLASSLAARQSHTHAHHSESMSGSSADSEEKRREEGN